MILRPFSLELTSTPLFLSSPLSPRHPLRFFRSIFLLYQSVVSSIATSPYASVLHRHLPLPSSSAVEEGSESPPPKKEKVIEGKGREGL